MMAKKVARKQSLVSKAMGIGRRHYSWTDKLSEEQRKEYSELLVWYRSEKREGKPSVPDLAKLVSEHFGVVICRSTLQSHLDIGV